MFKIAVIGRPNVGKSTFFNRLVGAKKAIVHDFAGVTRDRKEGKAKIGDIEFMLIDTPGLEKSAKDSLQARMMEQTEIAVDEADLVFFMVDYKTGITDQDMVFGRWCFKKSTPIVLICNKAENSNQAQLMEFYKLGFDAPIPFSAEHGIGVNMLYDAILPHYENYMKNLSEFDVDAQKEHGKVQIAIVGRPNAGKSTLINKILKKERMLTGPEAGITRDSIALDFNYKDQALKLIDTAGMRKSKNIDSDLEKLAFDDSVRAVRFAHVVVLVIDATMPLEKGDLTIAGLALEEGRCLVLAVNKWDLIEDKKFASDEIEYLVSKTLNLVGGTLPIIYLSALKGQNVYSIMEAALFAYDKWNYRVPTAKLNEWLGEALEKHVLPLGKNNKRLRIKYMTQAKTRPPTFALFCSTSDEIPDSYIRYLQNDMRRCFEFSGVPLRYNLKKSSNPYAKRK